MDSNKLKLDADKTEFIAFGTKKQRALLEPFFPVDIPDNLLYPAELVRNLGAWFDSQFTFTKTQSL